MYVLFFQYFMHMLLSIVCLILSGLDIFYSYKVLSICDPSHGLPNYCNLHSLETFIMSIINVCLGALMALLSLAGILSYFCVCFRLNVSNIDGNNDNISINSRTLLL